MELEQQVCSLPLAQRLKELGVKQESEFMWVPKLASTTAVTAYDGHTLERNDGGWADTCISAFTVAELGEMLRDVEDERQSLGFSFPAYWWQRKKWEWKSWTDEPENTTVSADTEAEARAKMLIYLLENGLIEL